MTSIKKCTCKSEFQDKVYGKDNRVFNDCGSKDAPKARCTICEFEKNRTDK